MDTLVTSGNLTNGKTSMTMLFEDTTKLYNSLAAMNDAQRINVFSTIAGKRGVKGKPGYAYFSGSMDVRKVKAKTEALHLVFENPKDFKHLAPADKVRAAMKVLRDKRAAEIQADTQDGDGGDPKGSKATTAIPTISNPAGRLKLPANLENATDTTRRSATSQYKAILSAEKKFAALSEKLAPQTRTDITPDSLKIVNARNASKLEKEKGRLDKRIKVYVNMYGEKATPEMLKEFTDEEREEYYNTGTIPDAFLPATL